MSRVGLKPIAVPQGVEVKLSGQDVRVKGPKGELTWQVPEPIDITFEDNVIRFTRPNDDRRNRSLHGLARSIVANMVTGVSEGYQRALELHGTGYRAAKQGKKLVLTVGYSHPVEIEPPDTIEIEVPAPTQVVVKGADKQAVGALAARIRSVREPEPYLGKGIRYAGERIRRKVGKTGK